MRIISNIFFPNFMVPRHHPSILVSAVFDSRTSVVWCVSFHLHGQQATRSPLGVEEYRGGEAFVPRAYG